ncbi:hypothetical protein ABIA32_000612 [Streptacidiphilus sp. MAP12-20]|uniref:hypothetical protein n=1 Tax=Streptacidiphilus sp. MAP12-20 TaxID=3156299 RepID=UPI0035175997
MVGVVPLLAVGVAALGLVAPTAAQAKPTPIPGSNGDVKVHKSTTPVTDERNNPKVCVFYLDAFHFDTLQLVSWHIVHQPLKPSGTVLSGTITLTNGTGHTKNLTLPKGMYKLFWHFAGEKGKDKFKVFRVTCTVGGGGGTNGGGGGLPGGGVAAGLGGSQLGPNLAEVGAGALLVTGGVLMIRRRFCGSRAVGAAGAAS